MTQAPGIQAPRIVVAGGGLVGLAFAIALRVRASEGLAITLIESRALPQGEPDPLDSRASALNLRSEQLLRDYGVWGDLAAHAAPIRDVHVSNQRRFGSALLEAKALGATALGHVIENHWLGRGLLLRAQALGISVQAPAPIDALLPPAQGPGVLLASGERSAAELVLLADGGQSALRNALGIGVHTLHTAQTAVVANVAFLGTQRGIAFERFTPHGPLALLPLPDSRSGQQRFNLVWSLPSESAEAQMALTDGAFLGALQSAFGWRLGRAHAVGKRSAWPLQRTLAAEQHRPGYLIVGNAAHALHPVAGQGFNLSLRDAEAFARIAAAAIAQGESPGAANVLGAYVARVADDQALTIGATDTLATLFNRRGVLLDGPRDAALAALDLSPGLKRWVAALGTGMMSRVASVGPSP